jgi:hypothetical protein
MAYLLSTRRRVVFKKSPDSDLGFETYTYLAGQLRQYILEFFLLYKRLTP